MLLLLAHSPPLAFLKFSLLLWTLRHLQLLGRGGMRRKLTNNIFLQLLCNLSGLAGAGLDMGTSGQSILTPLLSNSFSLRLFELSYLFILPSLSAESSGFRTLIKWYYRKLLPSLIWYSGNVNVADKSINDNIHMDCNYLFPRYSTCLLFIIPHHNQFYE